MLTGFLFLSDCMLWLEQRKFVNVFLQMKLKSINIYFSTSSKKAPIMIAAYSIPVSPGVGMGGVALSPPRHQPSLSILKKKKKKKNLCIFGYPIIKTSLFKYTENFTTKRWKFSDKNSDIFLMSAKNRFWVLVRTASMQNVYGEDSGQTANAQADLHLCCAHLSEGTVSDVAAHLIAKKKKKKKKINNLRDWKIIVCNHLKVRTYTETHLCHVK